MTDKTSWIFRGILLISLFLVVFLAYYGFSSQNVIHLQQVRQPVKTSTSAKPLRSLGNQSTWIVVSSWSEVPNDTNIDALCNISHVQVLLIGSKESQSCNKHANCQFLGASELKALGFKTVQYIPLDSYSRKNLAYLAAIQHGATRVYETDDDVFITSISSFNLDKKTYGIIPNSKNVFNSYRHFGQLTLRPPGLPFKRLDAKNESRFILSYTQSPLIQQGVLNGLPELDSASMTYLTATKTDDVQFDSVAPPVVIPARIFSPFNSKNTLFQLEALWAMVLPVSDSVQYNYILRSYWAQRMLSEIDGSVGFYPSTAYRKFAKFINVIPPYITATELIKFLSNWKCASGKSFFACAIQLSHEMTVNKFWDEKDHSVILAWISDLQAIGYREPMRKESSELKHEAALVYQPQQAPATSSNRKYTSKLTQVLDITNFCQSSSYQITSNSFKSVTHSNILLIIVFNSPYYKNIPYLQLMYGVKFRHIVYCGTDINKFVKDAAQFPKGVTFIEEDVRNGVVVYKCVSAAMKMNYDVDGYLMIGDDALLNSWNVQLMPLDKIWFFGFVTMYRDRNHPWNWWQRGNCGRNNYNQAWKIILAKQKDPKYKQLVETFVQKLKDNSKSELGVFHCPSDILYIPKKFKNETIFLMDIFAAHNVFLEIAVPSVIGGLAPIQSMVEIKGEYLWYGGERNQVPQRFKPNNMFMHPAKLSEITKSLKNFFCKKYFPLVLSGVQPGDKNQSYVTYIKGTTKQIGPL